MENGPEIHDFRRDAAAPASQIAVRFPIRRFSILPFTDSESRHDSFVTPEIARRL
jgi:hypothetical protein